MNIYILQLNGKIYKQFKTLNETFIASQKLIKEDITINIKIYVEEYNDDYPYGDSCCHKDLLYLYEDYKEIFYRTE